MEQIQFWLWTQTWQITLLFVLIWSVTRLIRQSRPHLALVLWGLFFVKCLVPPVFLAPVGIFAWQTPNPMLQVTSESPNREQKTTTEQRSAIQPQKAADVSPLQQATSLLAGSVYFLIFWSAGLVVFLTLSVLYFMRIQSKIYERQQPLPQWICELGDEFYSTTGLDLLKNRLVITDLPKGPVVFGFIRPVIAVPNRILDSPELARSVLAHEVCHIWRRDHWLGLLQLIVQSVFWFHPMIWLASRETNRLCEVCCDDDTLRLFNFPNIDYARRLLDMLEYQRDLTSIRWVPGIRPTDITKDRIQRILSDDNRVRFRRRFFALAFFLALMIFPAGGTPQWAIGFQMWNRPAASNLTYSTLAPRKIYDQDPHDIHRTEMNFLIGKWTVQTELGIEVGQSHFSMERSGNMIREDWTSTQGDSAQGITYYDPNKNCWVLTWVDGAGTIMDSTGRWDGQLLRLEGIATKKDGTTSRVRTSMLRENDSRIRMEMFVNLDGDFKQVSKVYYTR